MEAHAAVAHDAALAIQENAIGKWERLLGLPLVLGEAADAHTEVEGIVLQRTLAALVTNWAVQRVVGKQKLDDTSLCLNHLIRRRGHHHALRDRRSAGSL